MPSISLHRTFVVLASFVALASAAQSLSLAVIGPASVASVHSFKVSITLTNTGDETLKVLNDPRGPLNTLPTDAFAITDATGARPTFTGVKVKYVPTIAIGVSAYTILAPGQSLSVEHNLCDAYDFTAPRESTYNIQPRNGFLVVNDDSTVSTIYAETTSHSTRVEPGKTVVTRRTPAQITRRATYLDCSDEQQETLVNAIDAAQTYAANASSYIDAVDSATERYTTWFGEYTDDRRHTVASHFDAINGNSFDSFTYNCSCPHQDTFAYVYPDEFGTVYLCEAFWKAPLQGTDSQGGTIVHEASHFTDNAGGTQDMAYGQDSCKSLAQSDPDSAVHNADSYEYFAENDPSLD